MLPDRVSNPGPLTYESGALPIALRVPALLKAVVVVVLVIYVSPALYIINNIIYVIKYIIRHIIQI